MTWIYFEFGFNQHTWKSYQFRKRRDRDYGCTRNQVAYPARHFKRYGWTICYANDLTSRKKTQKLFNLWLGIKIPQVMMDDERITVFLKSFRAKVYSVFHHTHSPTLKSLSSLIVATIFAIQVSALCISKCLMFWRETQSKFGATKSQSPQLCLKVTKIITTKFFAQLKHLK